MKNLKKKFIDPLYYSLPVRLLILHLRKNQLLLLCWILLFSVVTGGFGKNLGIPYLFLDPEYLGQVNFFSFFIVGITIGGFTVAYAITCYILDGPEFGFLGTLSRPFAKFSLNNSLIPLAFFVIYIIHIVNFQLQNEYNTVSDILLKVAGFLTGLVTMLVLLFVYFWLTNIDMMKYVASNVDKKLKQVKISRVRVMLNLRDAKQAKRRVDTYLDLRCRLQKAEVKPYNKEIVVKIFNQNHLNSVMLEFFMLILVLALGVFRENPLFQIPAAASGVLLLTIIIMLAGAITYWLRGWATTTILAVFFLLNMVVKYDLVSSVYQAYGLNYQKEPVEYSLQSLYAANSSENYQQDKQATLQILENWRKKIAGLNATQIGVAQPSVVQLNTAQPDIVPVGHDQRATARRPGSVGGNAQLDAAQSKKTKMVFICTSGGGLRSALWTMTALQTADSLTDGRLMEQTQLITGASGGLVGAAYFRELVLRNKQQQDKATPTECRPAILAATSTKTAPSVYSPQYLEKIARDNLNPVIFTLLVNDLFIRYQQFDYNGFSYLKDRGYAFEQQLNKNTDNIMDKPLAAYKIPEQEAIVPMLLLSPAIVNDGRKLFISPQHVSYMNTGYQGEAGMRNDKIKGIDFMRFFEEHDAGSLRFLTALRMNAAFPYVTPNVTLPTQPRIQIMDAGLVDNFGVSDAVRFIYVFKEWISEHTSGVILLCIRDSEKNDPIAKPTGTSLLERMTAPVRYMYDNLFNAQDISNDDRIEYARSLLGVDLHVLDLEYQSQQEDGLAFTGASESRPIERPSLSWRLTGKEKSSIIRNINHPRNQATLKQLKLLLGE